jgi:hypothetical protein
MPAGRSLQRSGFTGVLALLSIAEALPVETICAGPDSKRAVPQNAKAPDSAPADQEQPPGSPSINLFNRAADKSQNRTVPRCACVPSPIANRSSTKVCSTRPNLDRAAQVARRKLHENAGKQTFVSEQIFLRMISFITRLEIVKKV